MIKKTKMDKRVKIRLIGKVSRRLYRFTPISDTINPVWYAVLKHKFETCIRWPETVKISREEFEKALHCNSELVDAYLDVFSTEAEFYLCRILYDQLIYHYCIMFKDKQIVLLYFRKIELKNFNE